MLAGTYAEYGYERNFWQAYHQRRRRKDLNSKVSGCAKKPGNISRRAFEKKFSFPTGSMSGRILSWRWASEMLEQFEIELYEAGNTGTVWERKVPEIRNFLEALTKANTLPVNGLGKLNKKAVLTVFGLGEGFGNEGLD